MTRVKRKKELPSSHENDVRFGTPRDVAIYRAQRICADADTIIEVGAGAGFQTSEFARHAKRVIAIDIDAQRLSRASFPDNVVAIAGDALDPAVIERAKQAAQGRIVVFLDPQRPAASSRRTLEEIEPDIATFIDRYKELTPDIVIELPPFLHDIPRGFEREYLSIDGELNRLTIYGGALKRCDLSIVSLPGGERLEHKGPIPRIASKDIRGRFLLEPDRALERAKLTGLVLPKNVCVVDLGNKRVFLANEHARFCKEYSILLRGTRADIEPKLAQFGSLIVHAALPPDEHKELARSLNYLCTGVGRAHLFLGDDWYLCERLTTLE